MPLHASPLFPHSWKFGTYDTRDIPRLLEQTRLPIVSCQTHVKRTWYVLTLGKGKGLPKILLDEMNRRREAGELGGPTGCLELTAEGELALCEKSDRTVRGEDGRAIVGGVMGKRMGDGEGGGESVSLEALQDMGQLRRKVGEDTTKWKS